MNIKQSYQIYEIIEKIDNIKFYRQKLYKMYKEQYKGAEGLNNPYSTENISSYLGMSKVHYKRLENKNDKCKFISLDNLIKLSYIYGITLDDFLKNND